MQACTVIYEDIAIIFFNPTFWLAEVAICLQLAQADPGGWTVRFGTRGWVFRVSGCAQSFCGMFFIMKSVQGHRKRRNRRGDSSIGNFYDLKKRRRLPSPSSGTTEAI